MSRRPYTMKEPMRQLVVKTAVEANGLTLASIGEKAVNTRQMKLQ